MEPGIKKGSASTLSTYVHDSNGAIIVGTDLSSVTSTVYDPFGNELIASTIVTPASDGKLTAVITTAATGTVYLNCRVRFAYTYDSSNYTKDVYFTVTATPFDPPIYYDDLQQYDYSITGMAATADSRYYLERKAALETVYDRLKHMGYEPHFIKNQQDLKSCMAWMWLKLIWSSHAKSSPGFIERVGFFDEEFKASFNQLNIVESDGEDANSDEQESVSIEERRLVRG